MIGFLFLIWLLGHSDAPPRDWTRQSIADDGQRLIVEFDLDPAGTPVFFRRTYEVTGWSVAHKRALLRHVVDSLRLPRPYAEVGLVDAPAPPDTHPLP
jgi:hypothetical protein